MIRKPSPGSSGSSRPASPSKSGAGASSAGSKAGTSAGTRAGTAMGTRVGFTTDVGVAEPAGGAIGVLPPRKPKPALVGLAIAGWATFVVQWIVVLVIILGRGGAASHVTVAQAQPASRPAVTDPAPAKAPPVADLPTAQPQTPKAPPTNTNTPPKPTPTPKPTVTPPPAPAAVVDKSNPFLNPTPNVLNVELQPGHTAVIFDSIERSKNWFDHARAALIAGLVHPGSGQTVSLYVVSDGKVIPYGRNPFTPAPARRTALTNFLDPMNPVGKGGLGASLDAAIGSGAKQVIFVTGRSTGWGAYLDTLKGKLNPNGRSVKLHIVQMGEASPELQGFIEGDNEGEYKQIWFKQLENWRKAAE